MKVFYDHRNFPRSRWRSSNLFAIRRNSGGNLVWSETLNNSTITAVTSELVYFVVFLWTLVFSAAVLFSLFCFHFLLRRCFRIFFREQFCGFTCFFFHRLFLKCFFFFFFWTLLHMYPMSKIPSLYILYFYVTFFFLGFDSCFKSGLNVYIL